MSDEREDVSSLVTFVGGGWRGWAAVGGRGRWRRGSVEEHLWGKIVDVLEQGEGLQFLHRNSRDDRI